MGLALDAEDFEVHCSCGDNDLYIVVGVDAGKMVLSPTRTYAPSYVACSTNIAQKSTV